MTKEKPILFSGPMVEAILEGKKTQTRRVIKPQPESRENNSVPGKFGTFFHGWNLDHPAVTVEDFIKYCPCGSIRDRLWVRETFNSDWCDHTIYKANGGSAKDAGYPKEPKWTPSIFMPRWASRINLEITDIRVERVQDISNGDAKAEGAEPLGGWGHLSAEEVNKMQRGTYRCAFANLWNSINGKPRADGIDISWKTNPFVWVVTFKKEELC